MTREGGERGKTWAGPAETGEAAEGRAAGGGGGRRRGRRCSRPPAGSPGRRHRLPGRVLPRGRPPRPHSPRTAARGRSEAGGGVAPGRRRLPGVGRGPGSAGEKLRCAKSWRRCRCSPALPLVRVSAPARGVTAAGDRRPGQTDPGQTATNCAVAAEGTTKYPKSKDQHTGVPLLPPPREEQGKHLSAPKHQAPSCPAPSTQLMLPRGGHLRAAPDTPPGAEPPLSTVRQPLPSTPVLLICAGASGEHTCGQQRAGHKARGPCCWLGVPANYGPSWGAVCTVCSEEPCCRNLQKLLRKKTLGL